MADYSKSSGVQGAWIKGSDVRNGQKIKILTESVPTEEEYQGKINKRNIVKAILQGETEQKNLNINRPSINALVDAYGGDSKAWIGKILTIHTEKIMMAGKRQTALYLVPDGFEVTEDNNGYVVVDRIGQDPNYSVDSSKLSGGVDYPADEINPEDISF